MVTKSLYIYMANTCLCFIYHSAWFIYNRVEVKAASLCLYVVVHCYHLLH